MLECVDTLGSCDRGARALPCALRHKESPADNARCSICKHLPVCASNFASKASASHTPVEGSSTQQPRHRRGGRHSNTNPATQHDGRPPPTNNAAPSKTAPRTAAATRGHSCARRSTTATRRGDASADTQGRRGQGESTPTHALEAVSPTAATTFLECEQLFLFRNLWRLPEPPSPALVRGSLVHSVLEHMFDGQKRSKEELQDAFRDEWRSVRDKYLRTTSTVFRV